MNDGSPLRILFAGTPDFAVPPLECLLSAGFRPEAVLTQPDRPAGRGRQLQASPVKRVAQAAGIPVLQPSTLKNAANLEPLRQYRPDLMIVVAYGLILPAQMLALPRFGCWNIHASLLPRWRGAAPIQRAIEAGDEKSGVCIMQMDEGLDTGPVMARVEIPLHPGETGGSLHDRLAELGASALLDCLRQLAEGRPPTPVPQADLGVSYAAKLDKREARIDWSEPAETLERRIRAFNPWPVTWCMVGPERTRIWSARALMDASGDPPGTVLAADRDGIDVATGRGVLRLLELQRPGKRRTGAADYLNAVSLPACLDGLHESG
jgi:methionyl-tRNA formyltransferase